MAAGEGVIEITKSRESTHEAGRADSGGACLVWV